MKSLIQLHIVIREFLILKKLSLPLAPSHPQRERERERERERYLLTHFTLVKNSVQITAIGDLLTIHRCYDVTQNESTIGITFGWLQALQHED